MNRHLHIVDANRDPYGIAFPPRLNLIDALAAENVQRDAASHYRRQAYKLRVQKWVRSFCLAVAVFAIVWIGGRELIGLVK